MSLPLYLCPHITREPVLSGRLDDPLWQSAPAVTLTDPVTGARSRYRTTARLLYSNRYLYLGFDCEDEYVWGTLTEHDAHIFGEECVEAFICPSGKMRQYYEINLSPLNTVFDAYILNRTPVGGERDMLSFEQYTCDGLLTRTFVDGELGVEGARGWSAEYAIPFHSLIGADHLVPEPGDEWRLNLYRIDAPTRDTPEYYAWSTPGKCDFHLPWRFGVLRFA